MAEWSVKSTYLNLSEIKNIKRESSPFLNRISYRLSCMKLIEMSFIQGPEKYFLALVNDCLPKALILSY